MDRKHEQEVGWKTVKSNELFKNPWITLIQNEVQVKNKKDTTTFTYVDHCGAVFVVPVSASGKVFIIEQYRYTIDEWCWEIPAGGLEKTKDHELTAKRELKEEIGGSSNELTYLGFFYGSSGYARRKNHFYIAKNTTLSTATPEDLENISQIKEVSFEEIDQLISEGKFNNSDCVLSIYLAKKHLNLL